MTIEQRIKDELKRLSDQNSALYSTAHSLEARFQSLNDQVKDYLSKINSEMPEYDKHDASHSEAVLDIIEQLLQEKGIQNLSLLEAIVLRFCCYFHDCGMILPSYCTPLLEKVEADRNSDPAEGLEEWLKAEGRTFAQVKDLFLIPGSQDGYLDLLLGELEAYQAYWQGLPPAPESMEEGDYRKTKRHDHLRSTHSERTKTYAANLSRFFGEIIQGGEMDLAKAIGDICAAHGWEYKKVRELRTELELFRNCPEMRCNVRYLAMLLRMGDLLHFGPDRASGVLYYEQAQVGPQSDLHWRAKMNTRGYRIDPTAGGGVDITYHGSFTEPTEYYFILDHMNRVDEELICYESFRREMEKQLKKNLYDLGLPEKVDRDHIAAQGFEPDQDLKFKLEHQNIIQLLMGARLYRDEFMCLRELYQNALDACRCMRAEQQTRHGAAGELEIEFGLGSDADGDYLYCKDQGTGMTMDIVKNYLLRIGNSYYKSDEFRRRNAQWSSAVAPVSEFGIGLLSCYMIADRIDVITRHYSAPEGEPPIWISMKDADGFGYRRPTNLRQRHWLGRHGTIVKLYLLDKFKDKVTGYIPEEPKDLVYLWSHLKSDALKKCSLYELYENSLYHRIQQFVQIPEEGIPVYIQGKDYQGEKRREKLFRGDEQYNLMQKIPGLEAYGASKGDLLPWSAYFQVQKMIMPSNEELGRQDKLFATYPLCVEEQKATASMILRLPIVSPEGKVMLWLGNTANMVCGVAYTVWIDGMPVKDRAWNSTIRYNFRGETRPRLTVDRAALRETPEAVWELREVLDAKLSCALVEKIQSHAAAYPAVRTSAFCDYIIGMLDKRFHTVLRYQRNGIQFVENIIGKLSEDVMKEHRVCGIPLYDWFHSEVLSLDGDALHTCPIPMFGKLAQYLLCAKSVQIENDRLVIHRGQERVLTEEEMLLLRDQTTLRSPFAKADTWPDDYAYYDAVSLLSQLIPVHTMEKLHGETVGGRMTLRNNDFFGGYQHSRQLKNPEWRDVLLFLQEEPKDREVHTSENQYWFCREGNRRYVAYVFVAPDKLTDVEDALLERQYGRVPEYLRGVREGWSILYYNYKNGYVIAPGIVDRKEMLKLLPDEVWNRGDGLEYYFTDGTRAF